MELIKKFINKRQYSWVFLGLLLLNLLGPALFVVGLFLYNQLKDSE